MGFLSFYTIVILSQNNIFLHSGSLHRQPAPRGRQETVRKRDQRQFPNLEALFVFASPNIREKPVAGQGYCARGRFVGVARLFEVFISNYRIRLLLQDYSLRYLYQINA